MMRSILSGVILSALAVTAGHAAGPVDPDWPCVQRRVPTIGYTHAAGLRDSIDTGRTGILVDGLDGMIAATHQPRERLCTACFSGEYPLGLPAGNSNADAVRTLLGTE